MVSSPEWQGHTNQSNRIHPGVTGPGLHFYSGQEKCLLSSDCTKGIFYHLHISSHNHSVSPTVIPILEQERKVKGKVLASELAGKETALRGVLFWDDFAWQRGSVAVPWTTEFPRAVIWAAICPQEFQCFPNTLTHHPLWQHRDCSKQKPLQCDRVLDWTMQRTDPWFSNNPNGCYLLINFKISDILLISFAG